jgi:hypothetical protein
VALLTGALILPAGGCILAADALSPGLLGSLGFDPNVIFPARGTIIVVFKNETQATALFSAFETADAGDLSLETRNFSVSVDPGESRNEVLECPVGALSPGVVTGAGDMLTVDVANAALVFVDAAGTAVAYGGAALISGEDYTCGDVILVTLQQFGDAFGLTVQVIPGR